MSWRNGFGQRLQIWIFIEEAERLYVDIFNTDKKYEIIYADPPWRYNDRNCRGACEHHYNTMKFEDICNLPINEISSDNCVLFLWTTYPMLKDALTLIEVWGFKYKTVGFQWIKKNKSGKGWFFGLGHWTRGNTEPCLIAIKGKPKRISGAISQIIECPIAEHSKKPGIVRKKIVQLMGDKPRIELFARQMEKNWDCWGNEVNPVEVQENDGDCLEDSEEDFKQMCLWD